MNNVVGMGADLLDVERFRAVLIRRPGLEERCFTESERFSIEERRDRVPGLAARFAAKEAVMKALGVGIGAFAFRDVEVKRESSGEPLLLLHGKAARLSEARGVSEWRISLSHTSSNAMAVALALG
ncbi:MAG: holo-ACP synthase [Actinomycetes bacterium]